jgi:hypothetical protein
MKALHLILGRRRGRLVVLAVAALTLAFAAPALAAESRVGASCDTGSAPAVRGTAPQDTCAPDGRGRRPQAISSS